MQNLQAPRQADECRDPLLPASCVHPRFADPPRQIEQCHTQVERARWYAKRGCGTRRMSVFDPFIRRFIVVWYPTIGNSLVRFDGPEAGHATRAAAFAEAVRFKEQAMRVAHGLRDDARRGPAPGHPPPVPAMTERP